MGRAARLRPHVHHHPVVAGSHARPGYRPGRAVGHLAWTHAATPTRRSSPVTETGIAPAVVDGGTDGSPPPSVDNLRVSFGSAEVVSGISFTSRRGRCLAIVGESGSGKSV